MIKEDISMLNVLAPKSSSKKVKQRLIEMKEKIEKSTFIVEKFLNN